MQPGQRQAPSRRPAAPARDTLWSRLWPLSAAGYLLLTLAGVGIVVVIAFTLHNRGSAPAPFGTPLGVPTATGAATATSPATSSSPSAAAPLAPIGGTVTGQPVDGIQCQGSEQVLFHIHAHLAVYVDGSPRVVPEGIGIMPPRQETASAQGPFVTGGSCYYWLHAHTPDGIIHIESPVQRTFTLGNYFDIWGIALDSTHVGPATGTVVAYLNGHVDTGDPRTIQLDAHNRIQLDVNGNVPPVPFTFPAGL